MFDTHTVFRFTGIMLDYATASRSQTVSCMVAARYSSVQIFLKVFFFLISSTHRSIFFKPVSNQMDSARAVKTEQVFFFLCL